MGNRATVIFTNKDETSISPAIYLHWNGGPESIYPFLDELDRREVRADQNYEAARFVAIVSEFFDQDYYSGLSLGIQNGPEEIIPSALKAFDPGDNGIFVVCRETKPRRVRRFESDYVAGKSSLTDMTPDAVEEERKQAYKSEYLSAIKSLFTKPNEREASEARRKAVSK